MGRGQSIKRYTPEEYYALEREAQYKSDYYDGEIFAMSGGSSRHSLIVMNIGGELRQQLKGKPCAPYESNQRLKVKATDLPPRPKAPRREPETNAAEYPFEFAVQIFSAAAQASSGTGYRLASKRSARYDSVHGFCRNHSTSPAQ
jgi:hypothetical protein